MINDYIASKRNAWAETTVRSEWSRLKSVEPYLDGKPENLLLALKDKGRYTQLTTWTRVCEYWDFLATGINPYREYLSKNKNLFKNSYKKERLEITYEEAKQRIYGLRDESIRRRALEILLSAQRYGESELTGEEIIGKGSKLRPNFRPSLPGPSYDKSYATFYRALKQIGLKPHTLRKLALTHMVAKGASIYDLMEVAGWSSPSTASSYVQPQAINKLKKLLTE